MTVAENAFVFNILEGPKTTENTPNGNEPLEKAHMDLVLQYIEAFFNRPVVVVRTPCIKFNRPLRTQTNAKSKGETNIAYNAPDLIECLDAQRTEGVGSIGPFPHCVGMLAFTKDLLTI